MTLTKNRATRNKVTKQLKSQCKALSKDIQDCIEYLKTNDFVFQGDTHSVGSEDHNWILGVANDLAKKEASTVTRGEVEGLIQKAIVEQDVEGSGEGTSVAVIGGISYLLLKTLGNALAGGAFATAHPNLVMHGPEVGTTLITTTTYLISAHSGNIADSIESHPVACFTVVTNSALAGAKAYAAHPVIGGLTGGLGGVTVCTIGNSFPEATEFVTKTGNEISFPATCASAAGLGASLVGGPVGYVAAATMGVEVCAIGAQIYYNNHTEVIDYAENHKTVCGSELVISTLTGAKLGGVPGTFIGVGFGALTCTVGYRLPDEATKFLEDYNEITFPATCATAAGLGASLVGGPVGYIAAATMGAEVCAIGAQIYNNSTEVINYAGDNWADCLNIIAGGAIEGFTFAGGPVGAAAGVLGGVAFCAIGHYLGDWSPIVANSLQGTSLLAEVYIAYSSGIGWGLGGVATAAATLGVLIKGRDMLYNSGEETAEDGFNTTNAITATNATTNTTELVGADAGTTTGEEDL